MTSHAPLGPSDDEPFQDAYGPTILSALGYIERMWGVGLRMGEVWFGLCDGPAREYRAEWNGHVYETKSDGNNGVATVDGRVTYEGPCGVRIVTDKDGHVLQTLLIE